MLNNVYHLKATTISYFKMASTCSPWKGSFSLTFLAILFVYLATVQQVTVEGSSKVEFLNTVYL